jgi:hypothetical protein
MSWNRRFNDPRLKNGKNGRRGCISGFLVGPPLNLVRFLTFWSISMNFDRFQSISNRGFLRQNLEFLYGTLLCHFLCTLPPKSTPEQVLSLFMTFSSKLDFLMVYRAVHFRVQAVDFHCHEIFCISSRVTDVNRKSKAPNFQFSG